MQAHDGALGNTELDFGLKSSLNECKVDGKQTEEIEEEIEVSESEDSESEAEQEYDQCLTEVEIDGKMFRCNGIKNWQTQICYDCRRGNPVIDYYVYEDD